MRDPKHKDKNKSWDLENQIRRGRKFSLTEAVGRQAGGALKGASPVAPAQQLLLQIEEILARDLVDSEGSLTHTIVAQLEGEIKTRAEGLVYVQEWLRRSSETPAD